MGLIGGKGGGKNALAAKPNLLNALRVQSSSYGQVIPILYGQNRISGRLLWSGDFQAIAHTSTQKVGGKGLGSGGGNVSQTNYTYQTAVAIALCMGPIQNMGSVWDTKGKLTLLYTSVPYTVPNGGGSFTPPPPGGGVWHSGRGVSRLDAYSVNTGPNGDFGSDGSVTLTGNQNTPMVLVGSSPGVGQYTLNPATGQHTFSVADAGKVMTITYAYSVPDSNSNGQPATKLNLTLFLGQKPQTPWPYLTSTHPGQDLGYNSIAYVASSAMDLGSSGSLPNLSYEILGLLPFGGGTTDSEPSAVISDLLSNPLYGLGTGASRIQSSGGSTGYKYYLDFGLSQSGVAYTVQVTIRNNGTTFAQVNSNFNFVNIAPGTTQNVVLNFTGNGTNDVQILFYIVSGNLSDPMDITVSNPYVAKVSDGINLVPVAQRAFQGWITGPGASVTVTNDPVVPLGDFTQFKNFCVSNGIFISPVLDAQKSAAQWIQEILDITNAAAVWSEGMLKIISYGDTTAVGNGTVFTPNTTPIYDLSSNDFLDVVKVKRPSVADVMNSVSVEFVNRANDYNVEVAEDKDEAAIAIYGLRKAQPKQSHHITTASVAKFVANLLRKREIEIRATYTIKLGWQFNLLEPMDLVTITVPELGYTRKPVRITAIRESDTGELEIDAEDFPWGTATPTLYAQQPPTGFVPNIAADPGNVNAPIVFEAPPNLSKSGQHEIWMAVSGASVNWGGCSVWVSQDNTEYHQVGRIYAPARMGVLTASLAAGGDPETTNYFPVDLTQSNGILTAGTQADADSYRTLCYCDGEFIAYRDANLTSANHYQVGRNAGGTVYVRRGLFGSKNVAHGAGGSFARLDDAIFTYVYDPAFLGKTIYVKFTSFNTNGLVEQSIANATAYQFIVTGMFCQMESASKNLLQNPGFESNQVVTPLLTAIGAGQRISDGWKVLPNADTNHFMHQYEDTTYGGPRTGVRCLNIGVPANVTLGNAQNFTSGDVISDLIPVAPGEMYAFGGYISTQAGNCTWGAGTLIYSNFRLVFFAADGANLGFIDLGNGAIGNGYVNLTANGGPSAYSLQANYYKVAATIGGRTPAFVALMCCSSFSNGNNGNTLATGASGFVDIRYDDCFLFPQWTPAGDEIGKIGSISVTYTGGLTYTSTTSSIAWSWNINANRTDLPMTVNNYNSSQAVTGLAANTSYNFYPFIDEVNQVVNMVSTGGTGSPAWAHTGTSLAWTQEQARGDHWPLTSGPLAAATTASGTGGGGGGGIGGSCLRHDTKVYAKSKGVIPVSELEVGDFVQCPVADDTPEGWAEVLTVDKDFRSCEWLHIFFGCGDWLATTPGHPFTLQDESGAQTMKRAAQLSLEDTVPCVTGITFPNSIARHKYDAAKVRVTIKSAAHTFYAGMNQPAILQHNFQPYS